MANNPDTVPAPHNGGAKIYDQKKKGLPWWLWLLPLIALIGIGMWWRNRPDTVTVTAKQDAIKPDTTGSPRTDTREDVTRMSGSDAWTVAGITDAFRNKGRLSLSDAEVHFATGSSQLEGDSQMVLNNVAQVLSQNPDWKMRVTGHTDNRGSAATNDKLAGDRAQSVVAYLGSHGVTQGRIRPVQEMGETAPAADNSTATGRAENRRVEIIKE